MPLMPTIPRPVLPWPWLRPSHGTSSRKAGGDAGTRRRAGQWFRRRETSQPAPLQRKPAPPVVPAHAERLVVVGNGMAGIRTVEELIALKPGHYRITVFGAESCGNYNRIMLSPLLAGERSLEDIITHPPEWYRQQGITLHLEDAVASIDCQGRTVTSSRGIVEPWDRLILATGSRPLMPPLPGIDLEGVCGFRDIRDVNTMLEASQNHRQAVVVGGGVLGLEAAWGLRQRGMEVTVVHMMASLMDRQLDEAAAILLRQEIEARGIPCITSSQATEIRGRGRAEAVVLADGRVLAADLVVLAVGIRPETSLARQAGLQTGRGIITGDDMRTSDPDIFAVGECVEHAGQCYGLVMPLWDMARVAARQLAGDSSPAFSPPALSTKLKVPGIDIFSAGETLSARDDSEQEIIHHDPARKVYKKLVVRRGRIVGTVLYGDVSDSARLWDWMTSNTDIAHLGSGPDVWSRLADLSSDSSDVGSMADDTIICHCNGVTRGDIVTAIRTHSLTTLAEVSQHTRTGSGCGQCTVLAARVVAHSLGLDPEEETRKVAARARRMHRGFCYWHRSNAVLMVALLLTGIFLHFTGTPAALVNFEWSHRIHTWAGYALCAAWLAFLGLSLAFGRKWRVNADGFTMFVVMPLVTASGLVFLWPKDLLPEMVAGISSLAWLALGHALLAVVVLLYLIHHLSHAPWVWWQKRKMRASCQS